MLACIWKRRTPPVGVVEHCLYLRRSSGLQGQSNLTDAEIGDGHKLSTWVVESNSRGKRSLTSCKKTLQASDFLVLDMVSLQLRSALLFFAFMTGQLQAL